MSLAVLLKLLAIFSVVALGWVAGRARWLGEGDAARTLSAAAFYLFVPALLFRTTARLDLQAMPWSTLVAFFAPVLAVLTGVYAVQRSRRRAALAGLPSAHGAPSDPTAAPGMLLAPALQPAAPAVRAISTTFGNTVQLGIPMAQALFGEAGLSVQLAIVSLHALTILIIVTLLVELDLAGAQATAQGLPHSLGATLRSTVRATVVHPVTLPVLAGLGWNLGGLALPGLVDETLHMLGQAVVPLCLVIIGISLQQHGLKGTVRAASWLAAVKLLAVPALVLIVGRWVAGLHGVPLATIVLCAALPAGSNALLFAQRYRTLEAETSAAIVISTFGFALTAPLWLLVAAWVG